MHKNMHHFNVTEIYYAGYRAADMEIHRQEAVNSEEIIFEK